MNEKVVKFVCGSSHRHNIKHYILNFRWMRKAGFEKWDFDVMHNLFLERISRHCYWRPIGGQLCTGMFGVPIFYQITCVFIVVFTR